MTVEQKDSEREGAFIARNDGKRIGKMTYIRINGTSIIIDHTDVSPNHRGEGVGSVMVKSAVQYAREENLTVIPLCPFARAEFDKHPDYADVRR